MDKSNLLTHARTIVYTVMKVIFIIISKSDHYLNQITKITFITAQKNYLIIPNDLKTTRNGVGTAAYILKCAAESTFHLLGHIAKFGNRDVYVVIGC